MACLQTMEYLGRLGLVPRNKKKERSLPSHVADSRESKRSTAEESSRTGAPRPPIDIKRATEELNFSDKNARTQQTTDTAEAFFPRTSTSGQEAFIDIEFLEYEHHVQSRAQALSSDTFLGAPGGRHAWKTLIFWKRHRAVLAPESTFLGAAATGPVYHVPVQVAGPRSHRRRHSMSPATVPLYMSEELTTSSSIRAWWEPGMRVDATGSCNRSPYVALGARSQRLPAATAPLYLV